MDIANRQYIELLARNQELEEKNTHLTEELSQAMQAPFNKYGKKEVPENPKKHGAPVEHPGWSRKKPDHIDKIIDGKAKDFLIEVNNLFKDDMFLHKMLPALSNEGYRLACKDICISSKELLRHPELAYHKTDNIRKRLITFSDELLVFLIYLAISPTNNASEQAVRNTALFRKITFGNMTERGKHNIAVIMTIIRTAMLRELNPIGVLTKIMLNNALVMPEAP